MTPLTQEGDMITSVPAGTRGVISGNVNHGVQVRLAGGHFDARLLLPAAPPGGADADRLAPLMRQGFGLLLPAAQRLRLQPGARVDSLLLLPYMEHGALARRGLQVAGAQVSAGRLLAAGWEAWLEPQSIIAVLIGL
jgi:hypothetical protein